jgi:hypothetical protein
MLAALKDVMVRPFRIEFPGAWYHVMNRGRRGKNIFPEKESSVCFSSSEFLDRVKKKFFSVLLTGRKRRWYSTKNCGKRLQQ